MMIYLTTAAMIITRNQSYSRFAEDDVSLARRVDVDVGTTDDEDGVLLASDGHLSDASHRLQSYTRNLHSSANHAAACSTADDDLTL